MKIRNINFIKETEKRNAGLNLNNIFEEIKSFPLKIENSDRVVKRLNHLVDNRLEPFDVAKERIQGKNDLMSINYFQIGFAASNSVCRIHVKNSNGGNEGYATGFMISPNLLMTNNHVFGKSDDAVKSLVEFNYQYNETGNRSESYFFELLPFNFFHTNPNLDYAIVAVKRVSIDNVKQVSDFGFLKLFEDTDKALVSENLSIIQHPGGGYKQVAIRENKLLTSDPDSSFITYSTDTTQGSSGSPVHNDQWQVVALHHSGVPKKDTDGNYLCKDGSIWKEGMDDSLIDWISNEGVRISSIIEDLKKKFPNDKYIKEMSKASSFEKSLIKENEPIINNSTNMNNNKITLTVPVEISVSIGSSVTPVNNVDVKQLDETSSMKFEIIKAKDQNYKGRNGYDSDFIKTDDFKIELLDLLKDQKKNLATILNPTNNNEHFLHYFNFSVAINKHRKFCIMTAVNINGLKLNPIARENNNWIIDPRMDEKYQTGPFVYAKNDLDRGHMVRRLDPVWGENAEAANDDTFHFSNSVTQHKNLNQKTWLSLEEYILKAVGKEKIKASVFTGPVFSDDDIPYRGTLLPLQFWKVAAMIKEDGTPSVTGYMLKQPDNIDDFRNMEGIKDDGFGEFKTYQVPLQKIANLTGIKFDLFNDYDPLKGIDFNETVKLIEINGTDDIKL